MTAPMPNDPRFFQANLTSIPKPFSDLLTHYSKIPRDQQVEHIVAVRNKAYAVHPYPCLGRFRFVDLNLSDHPLYHSYILPTLKAARSHNEAQPWNVTPQDARASEADRENALTMIAATTATTVTSTSSVILADSSTIETPAASAVEITTSKTPDSTLDQQRPLDSPSITQPYPHTNSQKFTPAEQIALTQGPIFLDLSSCLSQDTRKLAHDGASSLHLFASDITPAFIPLGYELFRDSHVLSASHFLVPGDVFAPLHASSKEDALKNLDGKVDIINAISIFHLFALEEQKLIAERCLRLLRKGRGGLNAGTDVEKGSGTKRALIVGGQAGNVTAGSSTRRNGKTVYRHNLASWKQMWEDVVNGAWSGARVQWKDVVKSVEVDGSLTFSQRMGAPGPGPGTATGTVPSEDGIVLEQAGKISNGVDGGGEGESAVGDDQQEQIKDRYAKGEGDGKNDWNSMVVGRYEDGSRWHVFWVWVEFY